MYVKTSGYRKQYSRLGITGIRNRKPWKKSKQGDLIGKVVEKVIEIKAMEFPPVFCSFCRAYSYTSLAYTISDCPLAKVAIIYILLPLRSY